MSEIIETNTTEGVAKVRMLKALGFGMECKDTFEGDDRWGPASSDPKCVVTKASYRIKPKDSDGRPTE